ncbi:MAG: hypothetical protein M3081_05155, partial [Gemmatimonadota bacterium]|nr:hypothetical protein [Gemmatimonadota bacterium]
AARAADSARAHRVEITDSPLSDSTMSAVFTKAMQGDFADQAWVRSYIKPTRALPEGSVTLYSVKTRRRWWPTVLGVPVGEGRVIVVADPNMLRNGVVRRGEAGVMAVRSLEWLGQPHGRPLLFDEFHHGFGQHGGTWHVLARGLFGTRAGRTTAQILIAGLVLLVAAGARPIPPRNRVIIERRSPLEHVGALARAYQQIGATRLATRRLVHGLRRRHPLGASIPDDTYLAAVGDRHPGAVDAVRSVQSALGTTLTPAQFAQVGEAIDTIERTLSK